MGLNVQKLGNKIGEFADAASGLYIYIYICIHIHPSLTVCIHNRFSLVSTHCRL